MWLGCALFPWSALHVIPWVQDLALADPLTYASEGLRAAVTSQPHLSLLYHDNCCQPGLTGP